MLEWVFSGLRTRGAVQYVRAPDPPTPAPCRGLRGPLRWSGTLLEQLDLSGWEGGTWVLPTRIPTLVPTGIPTLRPTRTPLDVHIPV